MNRTLFALGLLLCATPALAQSTAEAFQGVLERTAASPTRTVTFFEGLGGLPDGVVEGDAVQAALEAADVPPEGLLGAFLDGLERVEKSGSKVILHRGEEVTVNTGSGFVQLGKTVEMKVKAADSTHSQLTGLDGAKAGRSAGSLFPIRKLGLSVDAANVTTAKLNVGYALLNKTVEIVLAKKPPTAGLTASLAD